MLGGITKVNRILLDGLSANLEQSADGALNLTKLFPPSGDAGGSGDEGSGLVIGDIMLRKAKITYLDRLVTPKGVKTGIEDVDLIAKVHSNLFGAGGTFCAFDFAGKLVTDCAGTLAASGAVETGREFSLDTTFSIAGCSLKHIDPYCAKGSPIRLEAGWADVQGSARVRKGHLDSRFTIQLRKVKVSTREAGLNTLVLGVPTQAMLAILKGQAGELPLVVELSGDLRDPKFNLRKLIIAAIGSAFAHRAKQLGNIGVLTVKAGMYTGKLATQAVTGTGKLAVDAVVDPIGTGKKVTGAAIDATKKSGEAVGAAAKGAGGMVGKGLKALNPFAKKKGKQKPADDTTKK